jgi:hypothetical protein
MKSSFGRKRSMALVLISGAIPAIIILSHYFGLSESTSIPLIVVLILAIGTIAIWTYANRHVDGSEWWQDDSTSGWRGY